jgi:hypothetical protein
MNADQLKTAAAMAANAGLHVFFVSPGKIPFSKEKMNGQGWLEYATDDPYAISSMYDDHAAAGRAMNLAVYTGSSGLLIVDCDNPDAEAAWANVVGADGLRTLQTVTPREGGGRHFIYRAPEGAYLGNGTADFRDVKGLDIRAGNSYAVLPPSIHKTGREYRFMYDGEFLDWKTVFSHFGELVAGVSA